MTAVLAVVRSIPVGSVTSYGDVAARAGLKGRARWVGRVLAQVEDGAALPWYRVLRADGKIAFPVGSEAFEVQRRRLLREGVAVSAGGRVSMQQHGWSVAPSLDALLWAPPATTVGARAESLKPARRRP